MKIQYRNDVYKILCSRCSTCCKSSLYVMKSLPYELCYCHDCRHLCAYSKEYNDKIFKL